jgi:hypothetical protein
VMEQREADRSIDPSIEQLRWCEGRSHGCWWPRLTNKQAVKGGIYIVPRHALRCPSLPDLDRSIDRRLGRTARAGSAGPHSTSTSTRSGNSSDFRSNYKKLCRIRKSCTSFSQISYCII